MQCRHLSDLHGVENAEDVELPSCERFAASANRANETFIAIT
jgi:hypothetical protein